MRQSLIILILFLKGIALYAQVNPGYAIFSGSVQGTSLSGSGTSGYSIPLYPTSKANTIYPNFPSFREKNRSAKLYMKLDLGDYYAKTASNWDFKINANVSYSFGGSTGITKLLTISHNSPEIMWVEDVLPVFTTSSPTCNITITIQDLGTSSTPTAALTGLVAGLVNNNLRFTAQLVREYDVDVRLYPFTSMSAPLIISAPVVTNRFASFNWQTVTGALNNYPNFQLQILKLYNTDATLQNNGNQISAIPDWSKALTVETQSYKNNINLTIGEGSGYYLWRVRPIGTYFDGGIANSENYGPWSYADSLLVTLQKSTLTTAGHPMPFAFYVTDPDENLNWIYNRIFTEGDTYDKANPTGAKVSEGMSYADGLQRVKQNQKYNSEENTTITSQTINDFSGRPALTTLPVPVKNGLTGYKPNFVTTGVTPHVYTAGDFDNNSNLTNPSLINDVSPSAFGYYSSHPSTGTDVDNNFVPDAEGYSFKRTLYKTDGTNRVEEESGVGKAFSLGLQTNGQGRTTRTTYGVPSDDELIRLFGLEAPQAESVIKTTTTDQNNVVSVTYTSKEGKTIATALTSTTSSNLLPLDVTQQALTITNSINKNVASNGKIIASKRISLTADNTDIHLTYQADHLPGISGDCISGNCNFQLRFYMVDVKNNKTYISDQDLSTPGISNFLVNTGGFSFQSGWGFVDVDNATTILTPSIGTPTNQYNQFTLPSGEYVFIKEFFSTNTAHYADSVADASGGDLVKTILDVIAHKMQGITNDQKRTEFGTFMQTFKDAADAYNLAPSTALSNNVWQSLGITDATELFPLESNFKVAAISPVSGEFSTSSLQVTTKCCGNMAVNIPGADICLTCDGAPEAVATTDITAMISANQNAAPDDATPYGLKDFESGTSWESQSMAYKVSAIHDLVNREFIIPLQNKMAEESIPFTDLWKIAPGFSFESLNFMISNMLLSRYYTGNAITRDGVDYYAYTVDQNNDYIPAGNSLNRPSSSNLLDHNYDCKKLVNSWTAAIELLNSFELDGNDNNVVKEYDNSEGPGSALNSILNVDSWSPPLKRTIHLLEGLIQNIVNKFKNSRAGSVPSSKISALTSITANFMSNAGYQFAAIIDGQSLPSHVSAHNANVPDDYFAFNLASNPPPDAPTTIYDAINVGGIQNDYVPYVFDDQGIVITYTCNNKLYPELYYPYILKPEWMFKYFVYNVFNDATISDEDCTIPHQVMIDVAHKYNDPAMYVPGGAGSTPLCYAPLLPTINTWGITFAYTHPNWSASERNSFYEVIRGAAACPAEKGVADPNGNGSGDIYSNGDLPQCATKQELVAEAKSLLDEAVSSVNSKAGAIKAALIEELENSCYDLVSCKSAGIHPNEITSKDVDLMVQAVINQCLSQIAPIQTVFNGISSSDGNACSSPNPGVADYSNDLCDLPTCSQVDCQEIVFYESNQIGLKSNRKLVVRYFNDCDQKLLNMLDEGTFIPDIDPPQGINCDSKIQKLWKNCVNGTECNTSTHYGEKENCITTEFNSYSNEYPVTAQRP